jgi:hypothetical protein
VDAAIGLGCIAAFVYGRKAMNWKPMAIGCVLMGYTFFVSQSCLVYLIGWR